MGLWRNPKEDNYFFNQTCCRFPLPNFSMVMSRRRFKEIRNGFRFEDYEQQHVNAATDKIWKIRTVASLMKASISSLLPVPGENLSADEAMILFTGNRCPIIRAMPNKPISRGMKLYCLVDYETKVLLNFNVCDGQINEENSKTYAYGSAGGNC